MLEENKSIPIAEMGKKIELKMREIYIFLNPEEALGKNKCLQREKFPYIPYCFLNFLCFLLVAIVINKKILNGMLINLIFVKLFDINS